MVGNSNRVEHYGGNERSTNITIFSSEMEYMDAMSQPPPPPQVHKVCLPPSKTTFQKLRHRLSEIFFPDAPLDRFKNQTWFRKFILGLQFFFPIFVWAPNYNLKLLQSDVVSGLTIASLAIPQVLILSGFAFPPFCRSHFI